MAAIALEEVTKRYGSGEAAVAEVTLDVADGEFVILVGPSGCGKSTLLRMIAGLEEITSGEIRIDGERVNERPPRERNLAMVFQNYALYPHLSVFENIAFPLRLAKEPAPDVRRRVSEAARLLDLGDLLDRRPAQLSGGQRQRVAMGRALVRQPKAFLFDEPLSNLDARLRAQMRTEIARLQRRLAATTVYVTHDQTEAMTLGHRVAVLRRGVLQQVAPPRELYQHPRNLFVAGFLGSPAMNFVPGILEGRRLRLPFTTVEVPERMARGTTDGPIVAGIRPEHFDDAALVDGDTRHRGVTFTARIEATEWLGSEQFAYVPFEVPEGMRERLRALARDLDQESFRPELVVSLGPEGRISAGTTAELWLDQAQLQLFEVDTGENVT